MREQDQGLTTEDMAGRGSAPGHDHSPDTARQEQGGTARADRDGAPREAPSPPPSSDQVLDRPNESGHQPQDRSQPTETAPGDQQEELMGRHQAGEFQDRWRQVQSRFVDDPRAAVQEADALVAETMQALAASFAEERRTLEAEWSRSEGEAATEQLRQALRRYRSFFERLLST